MVSEDVADGVNRLTQNVMTSGTGTRALSGTGHPQGGKTGTTNDNKAVWFVGYTPEIAGAAMISVDKLRRPFVNGKAGYRPKGIANYTVPSTNYSLEGSGSGDAGQWIWKPTMREYLQRDIPKTRFNAPPREIELGKRVRVPSLAGLGIDAATRKLEKAGFTVERREVFSETVSAGNFVRWSPGPGATTTEFATIFYEVSKGRDPEVVREEREEAREEAEERAEKRKEAAEKKKAAAEKKKAEEAKAKAEAEADGG